MSPDWYFAAAEAAEANHDPDEFDGREWDELTDEEKHEIIIDSIY